MRRPGLDDELGPERLLDRLEQGVLFEPRHASQHVGVELPTEGGGLDQNLVRRRGEPGQATGDQIPDAFGDGQLLGHGGVEHPATVVPVRLTGGEQVAHEFLDEEGVAVGLPVKRGDDGPFGVAQ